MRQSLIFIFSLVVFWGCQKKPNASFTFDKASYKAGDSVILTNTSTLANTYRWTLPYGATQTTKDVRFKISDFQPSENISFKLEAFSKNRNKVDEVSQGIFVDGYVATSSQIKKAKVMFWCKPLANKTPIEVILNYQAASITQFYTSQPSFSNSGIAVFYELPINSSYGYSAVNSPVAPQGINPAINASSWNGLIPLRGDTIIELK